MRLTYFVSPYDLLDVEQKQAKELGPDGKKISFFLTRFVSQSLNIYIHSQFDKINYAVVVNYYLSYTVFFHISKSI